MTDEIPPLASGIKRVSFDPDTREVCVIVTEDIAVFVFVADSGLRTVTQSDNKWFTRVTAKRVSPAPTLEGVE